LEMGARCRIGDGTREDCYGRVARSERAWRAPAPGGDTSATVVHCSQDAGAQLRRRLEAFGFFDCRAQHLQLLERAGAIRTGLRMFEHGGTSLRHELVVVQSFKQLAGFFTL